MHILARDGLVRPRLHRAHTLGFDRSSRRSCRASRPTASPTSPASRRPTSSASPRCTGAPKIAFIRLGEGMTRLTYGGQALRAVALLPGVTGAYGRLRRRRAAGDRGVVATLNYDAVRKPSGPARHAHGQPSAARRGAAGAARSADPRPVRRRQQSGGHLPRHGEDAARPGARAICSPWCTTRSCRSPRATPTSCCRPRPTWRPRTSIRAYGTYYLQYSPRAVPPQGQAWSNLRLAQELARRMGLTDPVFRMAEREILRELFRGARGAVAAHDPDDAAAGRAGLHRAQGRAGVPHAVRQAGILLGVAGAPGPAADARLAARPGRGAPRPRAGRCAC